MPAELNDHASREHAQYFSASSSERWISCPASAVLAANYPKTDTVFTREGTLAHEVAEAVASGRQRPEEIETGEASGITPEMVRCAEEYRDYISGLCSDGTTKMLEQRVDFSQWVPGGFGTADCILLNGARMDVVDYKYGEGVAVSAEANTQMMLYGLGAFAEYGFVYDVKVVVLHIFQPRMSNVSLYETTTSDLLRFGDIAARCAADALSDHPSMAAGSWCKFCPHAGHCTTLARWGLEHSSVGDTLAPEPSTLTPEAVARILNAEPMISAWLKKVKEAALADALNGKPIPGYKVVEGKLGNRAWTDELKVAEALSAAGISREDYTVTSVLSPAAMDKSIGKKRVAELLSELISREPGKPTLAPESDKREALDRVSQAAKDFN